MKPKNFLPWEQFVTTLPKKRSGAGVILKNKKGDILLVKPSYKDHWSLPGGIVDINESPAMACVRETKEELGINISLKGLLGVHYGKGENNADEFYQFIFDGGVLSKDTKITVDGDEILEAKFVAPDKVKDFVGPDRAKRMNLYEEAFCEGKTVFIDEDKILK